jgi:secreted trypsin-like serine protease
MARVLCLRNVTLLFGLAIVLAYPVVLVAQQEIKTSGRVVGGVPTTIDEHPWQVALLVLRTTGSVLCSGSIIKDRWVLTAAHCFGPTGRATGFKVKSGATDIQSQGIWVDGERIEPHSAYNSETKENDIALVKLRSRPNQRTIPLANASILLPIGAPLEIAGWGAIVDGGPAVDRLRKAQVNYIDTQTCNARDSYNGRIKDGMMCAGYSEGQIDSCQGDSGGPLIQGNNPANAIIVGVVSHGQGCARPLKYGVYTRVSVYRNWIGAVLANDQD